MRGLEPDVGHSTMHETSMPVVLCVSGDGGGRLNGIEYEE